jgi:L-seryl-tRNA(Ser) seleniumtransferase
VCFSGDKLLGGPQCGIIVGRAAAIQKLTRHPLLRALRADKLCLAALSATLLHYLRDEALSQIPVWRMISRPLTEIESKAQALAAELRQRGLDASVIDGQSTVGGGSLPGETLPTKLVAVRHRSPEAQAARLRSQSIVARVQEGQLLLDPRTVGDWSKLMQKGAELFGQKGNYM